MTEQRMPGGRLLGAVRVGDTVRRPAQPWTPAVHEVLRHLASVGFDGAPRVLGVDEQGREMLTHLDGETVGDRVPWPSWVRSAGTLRQVGGWLRRLHDATTSFTPSPDARWFAGKGWRPGLVIGHHDAGPHNAVWRNGRLVGFVDWDTAGPSSWEWDLAFAALCWVPLRGPETTAALGFTADDDPRERLHLLLDAYGHDGDRAAFGETVAARARMNAEVIRPLASGGDPAYAALLPVAVEYEAAARGVEALPADFWRRPPR
ncbi:phosphotransferase [Micromonospora mangrovi]|uniref:Phosphotransferase n=2 Tax=Micromonospora TaxID=1873 RepID=A0AAU7MC13_9ACTN